MTQRVDRAECWLPVTPARAFDAWMTSEAVTDWLPPQAATLSMREFDPRPGGALVFTLHFDGPTAGQGKSDATSDRVNGRFVSVDRPERIVVAIEFRSEKPEFAGTMQMDWMFRPSDHGTLVVVEATDVPEGITPDAHAAGLASTLDNLHRHLTGVS